MFRHLIYLILKVLLWEICNMKSKNCQKVVINAQGHILFGSIFNASDVMYLHILWFLKILSLCLCHFQNIHLVKTWLPQLEKQMEKLSENAHDKYRLFLSAEPASKPENHIIPQVSFWKLQALKSKLYCKSIYPKLQNQDLST